MLLHYMKEADCTFVLISWLTANTEVLNSARQQQQSVFHVLNAACYLISNQEKTSTWIYILAPNCEVNTWWHVRYPNAENIIQISLSLSRKRTCFLDCGLAAFFKVALHS